MSYLTYSIWTSDNTFRLSSFSVSGEFSKLWKEKKGHLNLEQTTESLVIDFAHANGFTVKGGQIYK